MSCVIIPGIIKFFGKMVILLFAWLLAPALLLDPVPRLRMFDDRAGEIKIQIDDTETEIVQAAMRVELCDDIKLAIKEQRRRVSRGSPESESKNSTNTPLLQVQLSKLIRADDPGQVTQFISSISEDQAKQLGEIMDDISEMLESEYDQIVTHSIQLQRHLVALMHQKLNLCNQLILENNYIAKSLLENIRQNRHDIASINFTHQQYLTRFGTVTGIANTLNLASRPGSPFSVEESARIDEVVDVIVSFVIGETDSHRQVRDVLDRARTVGLLMDALDVLRYNIQHEIMKPLITRLHMLRARLDLLNQEATRAIQYRDIAKQEAFHTQKSLSLLEGTFY